MSEWYREGATQLDSFSFQGKEYPLNTTVIIKDRMYTKNGGELFGHPMVQVVEVYIDRNGRKRWTYALWKYDGRIFHHTTTKSPDELVERIETPYVKSAHEDAPEYYKDSEVPGMAMAWVIYIAAMIFVTVFNEFYIAWVFGTLYFFTWRKRKLKKPIEIKYGYDVYKKVREFDEARKKRYGS